MKKALIISGPQSSGKTVLANKLMKTAGHPIKTLYDDFENSIRDAPLKTDMIVVDGCPSNTDWEKFYQHIGYPTSITWIFITQSSDFPDNASFNQRFELFFTKSPARV